MPAAPEPAGRITLLTDFGTADGYVAAMRGVIAMRAPHVRVDDASHEIAPGDVAAGAAALARFWNLFPEGTVHLVVVDPGVGGDRRAIAVWAAGRVGVGPDNGVLEPMLAAAARVHEIRDDSLFRRPLSATFHGRDVFAPVAAYLAAGGLLDRVGPGIHDPLRLDQVPAQRTPRDITGVVVHADRFGNLLTNIGNVDASTPFHVRIEERSVGPLRRTYADVEKGELVALVGSGGAVEIAVRDGSAAAVLGVGRGAIVRLVRVG